MKQQSKRITYTIITLLPSTAMAHIVLYIARVITNLPLIDMYRNEFTVMYQMVSAK